MRWIAFFRIMIELVSQLKKMMQVSVHMDSTFYLSSLHIFDTIRTFNLYHIVEYDFEYFDIGCFEEEPTLKSLVIISIRYEMPMISMMGNLLLRVASSPPIRIQRN